MSNTDEPKVNHNAESAAPSEPSGVSLMGHEDEPPEAPCPECGHTPLNIDTVTRAGGSGGLYLWEYRPGHPIWMIPRHTLEGGYECEVTLECPSCGWTVDLTDEQWEAGR